MWRFPNRMLLNTLFRRGFHVSAFARKRTAEVYIQQAKQFLEERQLFEDLGKSESLSKETFMKVVDIYLERQKIHRRGHIEFLQAAMLQMQKYGVQRELAVYKKLLEVFPSGGKIASENVWQVEFRHYPRQQDTAMELLTLMEKNAVQPDDEIGYILADIFGQEAHVFSKFQRMMYWMPKLRGSNPWPFPAEGVPEDDAALSTVVLRRMSPDPFNEITVIRSTQPGFQEIVSPEDKFIAWAQSPRQRTLLERHPTSQPLFVEGPHFVFARHKMLNYFVLRSDPPPGSLGSHNYHGKVTTPTVECKFNFMDYFLGQGTAVQTANNFEPPSVHEQEDGVNFAVCITGSANKSSAAAWIRILQAIGGNERLADLSLIFRMFSVPPPSPDAYEEDVQKWLEEPQPRISAGMEEESPTVTQRERVLIGSETTQKK